MKLIKYKIKNYKTIDDTGWIDNDDIGCLVGVNESGKTNIITALLKLNPSDETARINALLDYPRSNYSRDKEHIEQIEFIEAIFELNTPTISESEDNASYSYIKVTKTIQNMQEIWTK